MVNMKVFGYFLYTVFSYKVRQLFWLHTFCGIYKDLTGFKNGKSFDIVQTCLATEFESYQIGTNVSLTFKYQRCFNASCVGCKGIQTFSHWSYYTTESYTLQTTHGLSLFLFVKGSDPTKASCWYWNSFQRAIHNKFLYKWYNK